MRKLTLLAGCGLLFAAACGHSPTAPTNQITITGAQPGSGTTFGGTVVTVTGSHFDSGVTVSFGGTAATNVTVASPTQLTATTGAHVAGSVDVVVTGNGQTAKLPSAFTYVVPAPQVNTPPLITSIVAQGTQPHEPAQFADADETIAVTATVQDAETPVDQLEFEWKSDAGGSFTGSGRAVQWHAPQAVPDSKSATLTVTVIEKYDTADPNGLPVPAENKVTGTTVVSLHDSVKEVGGMAKDFLDLFSQSSVAPTTVVHNFLEGCGAGGTGRDQELNQVTNNRMHYIIQPDWFVGSPSVTVKFGGVSPFRSRSADAWASLDVRWTSKCIVVDTDPLVNCPYVGYVRHDAGIDWVTAHYDPTTSRWWLCDSDYDPQTNITSRYLR
ncbi:MAG: IPT/TIG domain-containing protein [Betaproteobacteria bacterium]